MSELSVAGAAIADYETAMRDYGFAAVRDSAAMGSCIIGHRSLPV